MGNNFIVIVIVFAWLHWFILYFALSQTNGVGMGCQVCYDVLRGLQPTSMEGEPRGYMFDL